MHEDYSTENAAENFATTAKEHSRKKRKSMAELKAYTGKAIKSPNNNNLKFKGWSDEGKKFLVKTTQAIKDDVESGLHGEWEKVYRKIGTFVKECNVTERVAEKERYEVDYDVLYEEV